MSRGKLADPAGALTSGLVSEHRFGFRVESGLLRRHLLHLLHHLFEPHRGGGRGKVRQGLPHAQSGCIQSAHRVRRAGGGSVALARLDILGRLFHFLDGTAQRSAQARGDEECFLARLQQSPGYLAGTRQDPGLLERKGLTLSGSPDVGRLAGRLLLVAGEPDQVVQQSGQI